MKTNIDRAKIVIEAINGSIYLVLYRYKPNSFIYLKMSVFDTLMRNDGKERFYRIRQHMEAGNEYSGAARTGVLGRWCSKTGKFEMAHGALGEPIESISDAIEIHTFYVNVNEIRQFQKLMRLSDENRDGLRKVKPGPFSLI